MGFLFFYIGGSAVLFFCCSLGQFPMAKSCCPPYFIFLVYLGSLISNGCCIMDLTAIRIVHLVQGTTAGMASGLLFGALTCWSLWGQGDSVDYEGSLTGHKQ